MNNNLKEALRQMLFMSDQQLLWDDIDKINFKKQGWYKKYTWTEKYQEKFLEWLSEYLKKNWQGISEYKPTNKKLRDKVAREFVMDYGCVIRPLTIQDFIPTVSWAQLDEVMSKNEREAFNKWMFGQTTPLHGVYKYDLNRWLAHLPNID